MTIEIADPGATNTPARLGEVVHLLATSGQAPLTWSADVAGGSFQAISDYEVNYTTPTDEAILPTDASGNKTHKRIVITVTDSASPADQGTRTLLVGPTPYIYHTNYDRTTTDRVVEKSPEPFDDEENEGFIDLDLPVRPQDEGNQKEHQCDRVNYTPCCSQEEHCCSCDRHKNKERMYCDYSKVAGSDSIFASPHGDILVSHGWEAFLTRGLTLDLGVYFSNRPDGLIASERPAGVKRTFGWQVRLIKDTDGNVSIYWGDRRVESWPTYDMQATYQKPAGTFGTLTKQANNSFTRTTKKNAYYDFDSQGRLQTIKDCTQSGNVIYYNYNGSNQVIRISGPGMRYQPYFVYDGDRVSLTSLESGNPAENRLTYYRYDGSGRMVAVHGPENWIYYFDYDANNNLSKEINPDGFVSYFQYTNHTIPRTRELDLPTGTALYFTYDDTIPRQAREQYPGVVTYIDYNWAGIPLKKSNRDFSEFMYFRYDGDAKPNYARWIDGTLAYYVWDSSGQVVSEHACEDFTTYYTYGQAGAITSRKDELGRVTYWNYDAQNLQTNWIDALGRVTYFERNSFGQIVSKKDRRGNLTYYTYDTRGNHTSTQWPDRSVRYYDYNSAGEVISIIDELGFVSYYDHDARGRLTRWKDALGNATDISYDRRSNRTVEIDRRGNARYWEYDGLSRVVAERTALGHTTYFNYSTLNLLSSQVDPRGNPSYFYYNSITKRLLAGENALKERTYYEYTSAGLVQSQKDDLGCTVYFTYDCHERRTSVKDGERNVTYHHYDKVGNVTKVIDPRNNTTESFYDELHRQTALKDALGRNSYFYYDEEANRTAQEDALRRLSYYYFDSRDRQFCMEDAQKGRTYFTFTTRSDRSSAKDPNGNVTYLYEDALQRQFATRDARNNVTYVEYDAESNVTATKSARGFTTEYVFDKDNRRTSMETPLGELTYYAYDQAANQTSVKDARNKLSYFYFDALNRAFCTEDAKNARTYFTYDRGGNRTSVKDPLGRVTYSEYDCDDRVTRVKDALGNTRYFTYDPASNQNSVMDERGNVTYSFYDALNRAFAMRSPVGGFTYFTFDEVGNRTSVKDPVARFNYFYYDSLNRLQASEDGLQKRTYYTYDAVGNTLSVKNQRLGTEVGVQYFTFDALNRRSSFKNEVGNVWYYDYDPSSNLRDQLNPRSALTYWRYDALDRKESQTDPLGRTWYWAYDAVGNVASVKDGKVETTSYSYDSVNLNDRIDYPDGTKHYYEYDLARQRTAMADPTGRTTFGYDNVGRMTFRGNPGSQNLYYEYDAAGNRTALKDPDGNREPYTYDAANRMTGAGGTAGYGLQPYGTSPYGGGGSGSSYEYNLANNLVHETRANATITYHAYDAAGRMSLIQHRKSDGTQIERYDYTRDEAGNITLQIRGSDSMRTYWNYDPASRITKEAWRTSGGSNIYGFEYAYDEAGNRKFRSNVILGATTYWEYDQGDQMTKQRAGDPTTVYFAFDPNGNLSVEHDVDASAGRTYYDYDPRNLLIRVDFPGSTATNYFTYNALGERTRKDDSTGGKKYTWDGLLPILEKNLSNTTVQRMVKGYTPISGIGEYARQELSGTSIYPHKDQVGTTMRHTDSSQVVVNTYEYDAWGVPLVVSEGTSQQFRFTGKELDPDFIAFNSENRRYHFPARFYLSSRGVFGQVDKRIDPIRLLRYLYVSAQPTRFVDPAGLQDVGHTGLPEAIEAARKAEQAKLLNDLIAKLKSLCHPPCTSCMCPQDMCESEAEKVANLYFDAWKKNVGALWLGDWHAGHKCWAWRNFVWDALKNYSSDCFQIAVSAHVIWTIKEGGYSKDDWIHNFVTATAGGEKAVRGECTLTLDPWLDGKPRAYSDAEHNYSGGTPIPHTFKGCSLKQGGIGGEILKDPLTGKGPDDPVGGQQPPHQTP